LAAPAEIPATGLRVLLVEDSPSDAALLQHELVRWGFRPLVTRVDGPAVLREALADPWDLILCDFNLPGFDAFAALEVARRQAGDVPFVVLSGTVSEEMALRLLKAGAQDVVLKSNLQRLGPVIERELAKAESRRDGQQAAEALRETSGLLQAILDASPLAIVASGADGHVRVWNRAAESLFGWSADEVVGRPSPIVAADERASEDELLRRLDAGETPVDVEATRQRLDGTRIPVGISIAPLLGEDGRQGGWMEVITDLGRRKQSEAKAQKSFELVEQANEERRRLLDRLVRAQEEERERIANDIHDDSVQVLTALVIRLDTLRRRLADPELAGMVDEIEQTARTSITRLRHLMFELRPAALDRDGLVPALRLYLDSVAAERGLGYDLLDGLAREPGPACRATLYRIAQEALSNVVKHAAATTVRVAVEQEQDGTLVRIADDGRGFLAGLESAPGHLGLASMRERAELSGGWWRLESRPGEGTTVEFFVPEDAAPAGGAT
jgi:PAS domain S-box-containing protein